MNRSSEWGFRPRKKLGQIYINIPGMGSMAVEELPDKVGTMRPALEAARKAFLEAYKKLDGKEVHPGGAT